MLLWLGTSERFFLTILGWSLKVLYIGVLAGFVVAVHKGTFSLVGQLPKANEAELEQISCVAYN